MDKYEYKLRSEEIQRLVDTEKYAEAASIADSVDWRRVRSATMLQKIAALYRVNRRNEDSREILLLAYDRYPTNRSVLYSLCEVSIELDDVVQAIEYYKDFVRQAPRDNGVFTLRYKILEAQEASLEERIELLEELKKRDYQEEWGYELAYLYHRVGLATKCVEECDDIMLWFGDGPIVMKAMELKMLHAPLTQAQQQKYEEMKQQQDMQANDVASDTYTDEENYYSDEEQQVDYQNGQPVDYQGDYYQQDNYVADDGYAQSYGEDSYPAEQFSQEGYSEEGYTQEQYPQEGYSEEGYAQEQYPQEGYNEEGYPQEQYPQEGYSEEAYAQEQYPQEGYSEEAYAQEQYPQEGYNEEGYPQEQYAQEYDPSQYPEEAYQEDSYHNGEIYQDHEEAAPIEDQQGFSSAAYQDAQPVIDDMSQYNTINLQKVVADSMKELFEKDRALFDTSQDLYHQQMRQEAEEEQRIALEQSQKLNASEDDAEVNTDEDQQYASEEVYETSSADSANVKEQFTMPEADPILSQQDTGRMYVEDVLSVWEKLKKDVEEKRKEEVRQRVLQQTGSLFSQFETEATSGLLAGLDVDPNLDPLSPEELKAAKDEVLSQKAADKITTYVSVKIPEESSEEEPTYADEEVSEEAPVYADEEISEEEPVYADEEISEEEPVYADEEVSEEEPVYADEEVSEEEPVYADTEASEEEPVYTEQEYAEDPGIYADQIEESASEEEIRQAASELRHVDGDTQQFESFIVDEDTDGVEEIEEIQDENVYESEDEVQGEEYYEADEFGTEELEEEPESYEAEEIIEEPETYEAEDITEDAETYEAEDIAEDAETYEAEDIAEDAETYEAEEVAEDAETYEAEEVTEDAETYEAEEVVEDAEAYESEEYSEEEPEVEEFFNDNIQEAVEEDLEEKQKILNKAQKNMKDVNTLTDSLLEGAQKEKIARTSKILMDTAEISGIESKIIETTKKETKQSIEEVREFTDEEEELFGNFAQTKKVKKQIINALDKLSLASYTGNVLITGEPGLGTIDLAKNLLKEVQASDKNFSGKVAKISGEKLNLKSLESTFQKINNGALLIEKANGCTEECLYNMSRVLDQEDRGVIVIMEDTKHNIMQLLKKQAMIADYFNIRIDLVEMNNDTLVAYAKNYALEQEYSIDELGVLALYTRIADIQAGNHVVTVEEVKDIVDEAIWNSKRFKVSNFVDVLFAKRYDEEDMIVLRERDFI